MQPTAGSVAGAAEAAVVQVASYEQQGGLRDGVLAVRGGEQDAHQLQEHHAPQVWPACRRPFQWGLGDLLPLVWDVKG